MAAEQTVTVNRTFAYTDKDGKSQFFTRGREHEVLDVVDKKKLDELVEAGTITINKAAHPASAGSGTAGRTSKEG